MPDILKTELQDKDGNVIYPHTTADVVFDSNGEDLDKKLAEVETNKADKNTVTLEKDGLVPREWIYEEEDLETGEVTYSINGDFISVGANTLNTELTNIKNAIGAIPPASDKKSARFVIGNTGAGWTTSDCDYLCDGANDEVEIQAAINALPTTGGEIILLDGNYSIAANIQVDRVRTHIRGNGNGTILIKAFSSYGEAGAMFAVRTVDIVISNIGFYGNGGQNPALWAVSATHLSIYNCNFDNFKYGLYCDTSNYTKVESCHFANVGIGIRLTGSDYCIINNNSACNATDLAEVFNSNSNTIIGNTIYEPSVGITLYNSSSHNVVSGNTIAYADSKAISVESTCNSISGNTTRLNTTGIDVSVGHNSISGNVSNMDSTGIHISEGACAINGNVIHRNSYIDSQHSILLESTVIDCVVTGNICKEKDIEGDTSSNIIANNIGTGTTG